MRGATSSSRCILCITVLALLAPACSLRNGSNCSEGEFFWAADLRWLVDGCASGGAVLSSVLTASVCPDGFHHCTSAQANNKGQEVLGLLGAFCDRDPDCYGDDGYCDGTAQTLSLIHI